MADLQSRRVAFSAEFKICPAPHLFLRLIEAEVKLRRIKCSDIACVVVVVAAVVVAVVVVAIVVVAVAVVVAAVVVVVLLLLLAASMNEKKAAFVHSWQKQNPADTKTQNFGHK